MKALVIRALERELRTEVSQACIANFEIDALGWPILKRTSAEQGLVTNDFINKLRLSGGI